MVIKKNRHSFENAQKMSQKCEQFSYRSFGGIFLGCLVPLRRFFIFKYLLRRCSLANAANSPRWARPPFKMICCFALIYLCLQLFQMLAPLGGPCWLFVYVVCIPCSNIFVGWFFRFFMDLWTLTPQNARYSPRKTNSCLKSPFCKKIQKCMSSSSFWASFGIIAHLFRNNATHYPSDECYTTL